MNKYSVEGDELAILKGLQHLTIPDEICVPFYTITFDGRAALKR